MRHATAHRSLAILSLASIGAARAADTPERQFPLASSKLTLAGGTKPGAAPPHASPARWSGAIELDAQPGLHGTTLRVIGGSGRGRQRRSSSSGSNWKALPKGKGYRYNDTQGTAGGIKRRSSSARPRSGGRVKIVGGSGTLALPGDASRRRVVNVHPDQRHDALVRAVQQPEDEEDKVRGVAAARRSRLSVRHVRQHVGSHPGSASRAPRLHQQRLSRQPERHELRRPRSARPRTPTQNLVNVSSSYGHDARRALRSERQLPLAEARRVHGGLRPGWQGSPMPQGLPADLRGRADAVRLWIQQGAPEDRRRARYRGRSSTRACRKPEPPPDEPLAAPPRRPGRAVLRAAVDDQPRVAGTNGEDEVCYSTYYNLTGKVPDRVPSPRPAVRADRPTRPGCASPTTTSCCASRRTRTTASSTSTTGAYPSNDPGWRYECSGGNRAADGTSCDPTVPGVAAPAGADCGGGVLPRQADRAGPACFSLIGFGPPDYQGGATGQRRPDRARIQRLAAAALRAHRSRRACSRCCRSRAPSCGTRTPSTSSTRPIHNQQWLNLWFTQRPALPAPRHLRRRRHLHAERAPVPGGRVLPHGALREGHAHRDLSSQPTSGPALPHLGSRHRPVRATARKANPAACLPEPTAPIMITTSTTIRRSSSSTTPLALDGDDPASRRVQVLRASTTTATPIRRR